MERPAAGGAARASKMSSVRVAVPNGASLNTASPRPQVAAKLPWRGYRIDKWLMVTSLEVSHAS